MKSILSVKKGAAKDLKKAGMKKNWNQNGRPRPV